MKNTIWERADSMWRTVAVTGLAAATLGPVLYALADLGWRLRSIDETGADPTLAYRLGTPIAATVIAVLLAACWLVMVRTGRLALLWAAAWGLPCAALIIALLVTLNFDTLTLLTPAIVFTASQVWAAYQARTLRIQRTLTGDDE